MKRKRAVVVSLILLMQGYLLLSQPEIGANEKKNAIRLICFEEKSHLSPDQTYALGAFFHQGNEYSVRLQNWDDIGTEGGQYEESVGIVIVPYLQSLETGERYPFIPQEQNGYVLSCQHDSQHIMTTHPSFYPSILLTPSLSENSGPLERKALQRELEKLLKETPSPDFVDPLISVAEGFTVIPQYTESGISEFVCVFDGKKVGTLQGLVEIVFSTKSAAFLQDWEYGQVTVESRGIRQESHLKFTYIPPHSQLTMSDIQPTQTPGIQESGQISQTGQRSPESTVIPTPSQEGNQGTSVQQGDVQANPASQETVEEPLTPALDPSTSGVLPSAVPQAHAIEILVPELFTETDLSGKMRLDDCSESIERSAENPLLYRTSCQAEVVPKILHIQGFRDIPVSFVTEGANVKITVDTSELLAVLTAALPADALLTYLFHEQELLPGDRGKRLLVPFPQAPGTIQLTTTSPELSACNFSTTFTLQDLWNQQDLLLTPACRKNRITWPEHWETPVVLNESGCIDAQFPVEQSQVECLRRQESDLVLSWGKGWQPVNISSEHLNKVEDYHIDLTQFVPVWPFQDDDPWLQAPVVASDDPCQAPPWYQPVAVEYCVSDTACRAAHIDANASGLPDIAQAGWKRIDPLPTFVRVELKNISHNPLYQESLYFQWRPVDGKPTSSLKSVFKEEDLREDLPIAIDTDTSTVPFSSNAKFILFDSQYGCEKNIQSEILSSVVYTATAFATPNDQQPLLANGCNYATILKGTRWLSPCTQGKKQEGKLVYTMKSNKFTDTRKVLVVASSKYLGQAGRGTIIQNALKEWLQELQLTDTDLPLNLYVVRGDNEVSDVLYGEDLHRFAYSSDDPAVPTIVGKIDQSLKFDGEGFRPLDNLTTVKQIAEAEHDEIGKVLFFTDAEGLPERIEDFHIGTLLGWKQDGIEVTVVTDQGCDKWGYRNLVECKILREYPEKEEIKRLLGQL